MNHRPKPEDGKCEACGDFVGVAQLRLSSVGHWSCARCRAGKTRQAWAQGSILDRLRALFEPAVCLQGDGCGHAGAAESEWCVVCRARFILGFYQPPQQEANDG